MHITAEPAQKLAVVRGSKIKENTTDNTKIANKMFTIVFIIKSIELINKLDNGCSIELPF